MRKNVSAIWHYAYPNMKSMMLAMIWFDKINITVQRRLPITVAY